MLNIPGITQESPKNHPDFSATVLGVVGTRSRGCRHSFSGWVGFFLGNDWARFGGWWGFSWGWVGFFLGDDGVLFGGWWLLFWGMMGPFLGGIGGLFGGLLYFEG